ncbi:MAG: molybdopterin-binding protein [Thermoanaerobacteraceae bacterium]|nr:molybdopterin-binding protein [Thermoanaerobacteraceae bacterium]
MKIVSVEEAVGMVLSHDLTRIVPGEIKRVEFKKGHVITADDIEVLKSMGKDHIYVMELKEGYLHENAAASRLAMAIGGESLSMNEPKEGKVEFRAKSDGLFRVDLEKLYDISDIDGLTISTIHDYTPVKAGKHVASCKITPLVIEADRIDEAERIAGGKGIFYVLPFMNKKVGFVITGNEVYYGRIKDGFLPVFKEKLAEYGGEFLDVIYCPDDADKITSAILSLVDRGAEIICTGGGMAVDADDATPDGIRNTGAEIVKYGTGVLPGGVFMMAYLGDVPILGVPACGIFDKRTIFDILYPRALAGLRITRRDIVRLSHGGLCQKCEVCHYPVCPFGKP